MADKPKMKPIGWIGSSLKDLKGLPEDVQKTFGTQLMWTQYGHTPDSAEPMKGKALKGVYELKEDYDSDTYRTMYVSKIGKKVYVLHCFKKKSKKGKETPQKDIDLIISRLKLAKAECEEAKKKKR